MISKAIIQQQIKQTLQLNRTLTADTHTPSKVLEQ